MKQTTVLFKTNPHMTLVKKLEKFYERYKLRKEYRRLRLAAIEAIRKGDIKRSVALDARADRMLDQVIY
jgi:hypothetical protein